MHLRSPSTSSAATRGCRWAADQPAGPAAVHSKPTAVYRSSAWVMAHATAVRAPKPCAPDAWRKCSIATHGRSRTQRQRCVCRTRLLTDGRQRVQGAYTVSSGFVHTKHRLAWPGVMGALRLPPRACLCDCPFRSGCWRRSTAWWARLAAPMRSSARRRSTRCGVQAEGDARRPVFPYPWRSRYSLGSRGQAATCCVISRPLLLAIQRQPALLCKMLQQCCVPPHMLSQQHTRVL